MIRIIFSFLICIFAVTSFACTTFCINKNGRIVFGRNYDWVTGAGIVCTNQRGLYKTSFKTDDGATINWVSKYGSLTFNQYGKEFPTGGMNENGLVVELMWLDETQYPKRDGRPAINVLQWIQYQLDNCSGTDEVIATDALLRITSNGTPIHYLVADKKGNIASIEFLNGKMVVHRGNALPFPVLTNNTYEQSSQTATALLKKNNETSSGNNSLDRFVKACSMIKQFNETNIDMPVTDYAFNILDKVSQGDYTKWSIVYDISNKKIFFKTNSARDIKLMNLAGFDFSCNSFSKIFDMNQEGKGDITSKFILPHKELKRKILEQAITESSSQVSISNKRKEEILSYETAVKCK